MKSNDKKVSFLFQTWMVFRNSTPTEYTNIWNSGGRSKLISLQVSSPFGVACATDEIKLWFSPYVKLRQNPCSSPTTCVSGFEYAPWLARYKPIVDLPIRLNRTSKRFSGNSLRPLEAPNKDFGEKGKLPRYCKLGGSAPQEKFLNLGAQNCHILSKKRRQQFKYPVLSVRYSVTGEQGKTLTSSRRLQEKGETSSLQTGKDTNIMRQIYQSSRFNDKNAFRK